MKLFNTLIKIRKLISSSFVLLLLSFLLLKFNDNELTVVVSAISLAGLSFILLLALYLSYERYINDNDCGNTLFEEKPEVTLYVSLLQSISLAVFLVAVIINSLVLSDSDQDTLTTLLLFISGIKYFLISNLNVKLCLK